MAFLHLLATLVLADQTLTSAAGECIRDYHELEASLVDNDLNLDSLTRSFFPPNEPSVPVVDVFYTVSDSLDPDQHPLVLEIQGLNETELIVLAQYRYRWSETPIYLFMDPNVLELLALFTIRLRYHAVRVVVRPMCDNYTIDGIPLPEYHLNQMTALLKIYAINRKKVVEEGLEADSSNLQGYASFYNESDYFVIGISTSYQENMFLLIFGLIALATFITIATPLLLNAQYDTLYKLANQEQSNALFVIWAGAIVYIIATLIVLIVDIYFLLVQRLSGSVPAVWVYYLAIVVAFACLVFDLILTIFVKKKRDFPLPYVLQILCCQADPLCRRNTILIQTVAIWLGIVFMQLVAFHMTFIFLAFVASPVQTGSTVLLFITAIFSGISIVTLFLAAFQKRDSSSTTRGLRHFRFYLQKSLYLVLFICVLIFTIFFATCFIRITIYVGDIQSGGIPALFASLAPSALLGGMGYLGKKVLENYVPRDKVKTEDDDVEAAPYLRMSSTDVTPGAEEKSQIGQALSQRRHSDHTQEEAQL